MHDERFFGRWLKERRKALDLTQEALGELVGCAGETIRRFEAERSRPSRDMVERLAAALDLAPGDHDLFVDAGRAVATAARSLAVIHLTASPESTQAPPQRSLPLPVNSLIGRAREVADVCTMLERHGIRLLTLVGPPGIGKTRLGLQVAAELADTFVDGVVFVALAPITDSSLVISALAQALGLKDATGLPLTETVSRYLRHKRLLLLLDNFEQIVDGALHIATLLQAAPGMQVLVTSLRPLHLSGEHTYVVPPLALPDPQQVFSTEAIAHVEAVRLFVVRAQAACHDFSLTSANGPAVAELCRRLDGLPLAIELAAARVTLFPPAMMLTRLEHRFAVLTGGARDLPARQQTLRSAIAWSYRLLTPAEQRLFNRLGVFTGGWTLAAAEAICAADAEPSLYLVDMLHTLLDTSLVQRMGMLDGEPRFTMLESMRDYAREQLITCGELDDLQQRHAAFFVALAEQGAVQLLNAAQQSWFERLTQDHHNLRCALQWALDHGEAELALRFGGALWWFWFVHGHLAEGCHWLDAVLEASAGMMSAARVTVLSGAGILEFMHYNASRALDLLQEGLTCAQDIDDPAALALANLCLGAALLNLGPADEAAARLTEGRQLFGALHNTWGSAFCDFCLGRLTLLAGDVARAAPLLETSCEGFRAVGDRCGLAWVLHALGHVRQWQGATASAAALFAEGLGCAMELGSRQVMAECLEGLAGVAIDAGKAVQGVRLLGAAEGLREAVGAARFPPDQAAFERLLARARIEMDAATFSAQRAEGQAMTVEQAVGNALSTLRYEAVAPAPSGTAQPGRGSLAQPARHLTAREVDVLRIVAEGGTDQEVAQRLGLKLRTVTSYLTSIYAKLEVRTRMGAVRVAREQHVI